MGERRFYVVKDECDRLVAVFTDKDDCLEFVEPPLYYDEVVI